MSFSKQSKFSLLRDARKVANREVHGAHQDDSDQPVGRPEFLPHTAHTVPNPYVQSSRASSVLGEDMDVQSVGFASVVSNKTRVEGDGGNIIWDETVQRYRNVESGAFVSKKNAVAVLSESAEQHQPGAGLNFKEENESVLQTVAFLLFQSNLASFQILSNNRK